MRFFLYEKNYNKVDFFKLKKKKYQKIFQNELVDIFALIKYHCSKDDGVLITEEYLVYALFSSKIISIKENLMTHQIRLLY